MQKFSEVPLSRRTLLGALAASGTAALLGAPIAQANPRLVGMGGLQPNAMALKEYIASNYPVPAIGGVRPDSLPDHPSGRALDFMVYGDSALGNAIHADIQAQADRFGVKYQLWQVANHWDHVHTSVY